MYIKYYQLILIPVNTKSNNIQHQQYLISISKKPQPATVCASLPTNCIIVETSALHENMELLERNNVNLSALGISHATTFTTIKITQQTTNNS
jgi:hypothetical protein